MAAGPQLLASVGPDALLVIGSNHDISVKLKHVACFNCSLLL